MQIDFIKSKINLVEARIKQLKESDLFTDTEREALLEFNTSELEYYNNELAKLIDVKNPEIL